MYVQLYVTIIIYYYHLHNHHFLSIITIWITFIFPLHTTILRLCHQYHQLRIK
jgi:hypothetical protein